MPIDLTEPPELSVVSPYLSHHAFARALFGGTMVIWVATEVRQALKRRAEATSRDHASRLVIVVFAAAGFLLARLARAWVPAADFPDDSVTFGIGLAIIWCGIALRWWAFRTLGRYFTIDVMTSADQPVIAAGPYRFVRHPSYAALLLILAGLGVILFGNWLSMAAVTLFSFLGLLNRIRVEEAALSTTLGATYRSYAAGHKRIIPFVW